MAKRQEQDRLGRRRERATAVVLAAAAPLAVWLVAEFVFGVEVRSPDFGPGQPSKAIGPVEVVLTGLVASVAGWGLLAGLERVTNHPRALWTTAAVLVTAASLGGPFGGQGITAANQVTLLLMHLAVGTVLIPRLHRSAGPPPRPHGPDADAVPQRRPQYADPRLPR